MSDSVVSQARQAVLSVLRGVQDPSIKEAQAWLDALQNSDELWDVCLALCAPQEPIQVQFTAATLLKQKVRSHWPSLNAETRCALLGAFKQIFYTSVQTAMPRMVIIQLSVLRASTVGEMDGWSMVELAEESFGLLQTAPLSGLDLLVAAAEVLVEKRDCMDSKMFDGLACIADDIINVLGLHFISKIMTLRPNKEDATNSTSDKNPEPGVLDEIRTVLKALKPWIKVRYCMDSFQSRGILEFSRKFSALLKELLVVAVMPPQDDDTITECASQSIIEILENSTCDQEAIESNEVDEISSLMAHMGSIILNIESNLQSKSLSVAISTVGMACALIEYWPEGFAGKLALSHRLSSFMLHAMSRPEPEITEIALDYFLTLNTTAKSDRVESLRKPLFYSLLSSLMLKASYPDSFVSWEECDSLLVDEATFERLRSITLKEGFEECFGALTGIGFLEFIYHTLLHAEKWNHVEAALFSLGSVALPARLQCLNELSELNEIGGKFSNNDLEAFVNSNQATYCYQFLDSILSRICSIDKNELVSYNCLASTVCWIMESYAIYLNRSPSHNLLQDCVLLVLHLISQDGSHRTAGCKAFLALCRRGSAYLSNTTILEGLLKEVYRLCTAGSQQLISSLSLSQEIYLIQGITQLIAVLPVQESEIMAVKLTEPWVRELNALKAMIPDSSNEVQAVLTRRLKYLSASFRALLPAALSQDTLQAPISLENSDFRAFSGPSALVMTQTAQILEEIAKSSIWQQHVDVMDALAEVYKEAILSARKQSYQLLPAVVPATVTIFEHTANPMCLEVLSELLEAHFNKPDVVSSVESVMLHMLSVSYQYLTPDVQNVREHESLAMAFLNLGDSLAVFAPNAFRSGLLFSQLLDLSILSVQCREIEIVSKALNFFLSAISIVEQPSSCPEFSKAEVESQSNEFSNVLNTVLSRIPYLSDALAVAFLNTSPIQLLQSIAKCLQKILMHSELGPRFADSFLRSIQNFPIFLNSKIADSFYSIISDGPKSTKLLKWLVEIGLKARHQESSDISLIYALR